MSKISLFLLLFLFLSGHVSGQNWHKISKEIKRGQLSLFPDGYEKIKRYYSLRNNSKILQKMDICLDEDTVFVLQRNSVVDLRHLWLMTWNGKDTLTAFSEDLGETCQVIAGYSFTRYMMKLVSEWNYEKIQKEESTNLILPIEGILATRIIFNGGKREYSFLYFHDFFNLDRDYNDYDSRLDNL